MIFLETHTDCDTVMGNCGQCKVEPYELYSDQSLMVGSRHGYQQFGGEWTHLPMPKKAWFIFDQDAYDAGAISPELT
ncbi:MAG: hypothetical protein IKE43_11325 [Coriobacteriales bacterium]|nr:hypothetical protein [Coriobacteriales bacterium]